MVFTAYALYNQERDKLYVGHTADIEKRLMRHNNALPNKSTSFTRKNSGDWKLIYREDFKTRAEAMKREKELKTYQGRIFLRSF